MTMIAVGFVLLLARGQYVIRGGPAGFSKEPSYYATPDLDAATVFAPTEIAKLQKGLRALGPFEKVPAYAERKVQIGKPPEEL